MLAVTLPEDIDTMLDECSRETGKSKSAIMEAALRYYFQELEDRLDVEEARRRLADPSEVPIPFDQVRQELGF